MNLIQRFCQIGINKDLTERFGGHFFPILRGEISYLEHRIVVMEPLYGNIFERFKRRPASVDALRIILFQLMLALQALERMNIVHLNVRTQNIMCVSETRNNYRVKVRNIREWLIFLPFVTTKLNQSMFYPGSSATSTAPSIAHNCR